MTLIPSPTDQFIEKVKTRMRAEEIQNFSEDEINRVFEYVVQSEACIRVVNYLINYQNFTIEQLYRGSNYKKYRVSHTNHFGGGDRIIRFVYSAKETIDEILDDVKRYPIEEGGAINDCDLNITHVPE